MVKCPHCGRDAMTLGQKATLGPGRVVACRACEKPIAAHWAAIFAALPAFGGGMFLLQSESTPLGLVALVAGVAAMAAIQTFAVPLVKVGP